MGAEIIKMEVQVWVAEAVENGSAGLEAETNSIKMAVQVEAERKRWQCRCRSLNRRDKSADVRSEAVLTKGRPGVGAKQWILNMQMWE